MKTIYGDTSLLRRAKRLAERPKCGFTWTTQWNPNDVTATQGHICVRLKNHAGRDHKCACGAFKLKTA